jgi:copper chaperone CopZ
MSMMELALNEVACTSCIGRIKKGLKKYPGVEKVRVVTGRGKIEIDYNEEIIQPEVMKQKVNKLAIRIFD